MCKRCRSVKRHFRTLGIGCTAHYMPKCLMLMLKPECSSRDQVRKEPSWSPGVVFPWILLLYCLKSSWSPRDRSAAELAGLTARPSRHIEGRVLLPTGPCPLLPALVQRHRQDEDEDDDRKHHRSNDEEQFSGHSFLLAGALNATFGTLLVNSSGWNHCLNTETVVFSFIHVNQKLISVGRGLFLLKDRVLP